MDDQFQSYDQNTVILRVASTSTQKIVYQSFPATINYWVDEKMWQNGGIEWNTDQFQLLVVLEHIHAMINTVPLF